MKCGYHIQCQHVLIAVNLSRGKMDTVPETGNDVMAPVSHSSDENDYDNGE